MGSPSHSREHNTSEITLQNSFKFGTNDHLDSVMSGLDFAGQRSYKKEAVILVDISIKFLCHVKTMGILHVFLTTVVCFHGFCAMSSVLLLSSVCSEVFVSWQDVLVLIPEL